MGLCKIHECGRPSRSKGMCIGHYARKRKYGDPLHGGPLGRPKGSLIKWIKDVALHYESNVCLKWPFSVDKDGYGIVRHKGKSNKAHRLVLELYAGPPPSKNSVCRHSCGKGHEGCVNPVHLSWGTHKQNAHDRVIHGTDPSGSRNPRCILTDNDVMFIAKAKGNITQHKLAKIYGVSRSAIAHIHSGKNRSEITGINKSNGQ